MKRTKIKKVKKYMFLQKSHADAICIIFREEIEIETKKKHLSTKLTVSETFLNDVMGVLMLFQSILVDDIDDNFYSIIQLLNTRTCFMMLQA